MCRCTSPAKCLDKEDLITNFTNITKEQGHCYYLHLVGFFARVFFYWLLGEIPDADRAEVLKKWRIASTGTQTFLLGTAQKPFRGEAFFCEALGKPSTSSTLRPEDLESDSGALLRIPPAKYGSQAPIPSEPTQAEDRRVGIGGDDDGRWFLMQLSSSSSSSLSTSPSS